MSLGRALLGSLAALGGATAATFVVCWAMRPAVVPDDVDAVRLVALNAYEPYRVEFRLENAGPCPVLVATENEDPGVRFEVSIYGSDGMRVRPPIGCGLMSMDPPRFRTLAPGQRSAPLSYPLAHWRPSKPGRYRFVATYRYIPLDVRWQGLPILSRWCDVNSDENAARIRRTRAFTRTMDFEIDLP